VFAGIHPPTKRGRKGATAFFCSKGVFIPSQKFCEKPFTNSDGKVIRSTLVEILALGTQTVIPDTIHPDTGKPYRWVHASLEEVRHPRDLPVITPGHVSQIAEILAPFMAAPKARAEDMVKVHREDVGAIERRRYEGLAASSLKRLTDRLVHRGKPGRNRELYTCCYFMTPYLSGGFIKESEVRSAFEGACRSNNLVRDNTIADVRRTMDAAFANSTDGLPDLSKLEDRPFDRRAAA
jgi:hypothetical protein